MNKTKSKKKYADFGIRFGAHLLDNIMALGVFGILFGILFFLQI